MAKQPGINLNNRSLGMSSDEYSGGSFLYGENIDIHSSSKSFKISSLLTPTNITNRNSNIVSLVGPYMNGDVISFSDDGYIESPTYWNENSTNRSLGGFLYKRSTGGRKNAIRLGLNTLGNYTIGIYNDKIDLFTGDLFATGSGGLFETGTELVTTPLMSSSTGRTVGSGWFMTTPGATHTSGTDTLKQTITTENAKKYRFAIHVDSCSVGTCTISIGGNVVGTISSTTPKRSTYVVTTTSTSTEVIYTPSTDFNGVISYTSLIKYSETKIEENKATITGAAYHPVLSVGGRLLIGSGSSLDSVDLTTWSVDTYNLVDMFYSIVGIEQIGQNIIICATDGEDTKWYYRDGISDAPSEVIAWKDKVVTNIDSDGSLIYALSEDNYKKELYLMSGYDKKPLAIGKRRSMTFGYNVEAYKLILRNDFHNDLAYPNAMSIIGNKIMIPSYFGVYSYGYESPGMTNSLIKEFRTESTPTVVSNIGGLTYIAYKTNTNTVVASITPYLTNQSGYVVSNPILWDNFSTTKQLNHFRIGYIIPYSGSSIDIYLSADKYKFRTFTVTGVSVSPTTGAIYTSGETSPQNTYEVISYSGGQLSCKCTALQSTVLNYTGTLTKVSGIGDSTITFTDNDNFIKVKTITSTKYIAGEELIFGQEFLSTYMPDRHTIQIKIKLTGADTIGSPIIFDIPFIAEPVGQNG